MNIIFPIDPDIHLAISSGPDPQPDFPTSRLQKGLLLIQRGKCLTEEAVGFGFPVLNCGLQTLFPGSVNFELIQPAPLRIVRASYRLDLVERISRQDSSRLNNRLFYAAKDGLAALLRRIPPLRAPLTFISSGARSLFGWQTTYEPASFYAEVRLVYTLDPVSATLRVNLLPESRLPDSATELVIMNEQGAHFFDRYEDSSGLRLSGKEIGCWDEVTAGRAGFSSSSSGIRFSVEPAPQARLFRGRELIGSRLAWAGFGHVMPCPPKNFEFNLQIEKIP